MRDFGKRVPENQIPRRLALGKRPKVIHVLQRFCPGFSSGPKIMLDGFCFIIRVKSIKLSALLSSFWLKLLKLLSVRRIKRSAFRVASVLSWKNSEALSNVRVIVLESCERDTS